MEDGYGFVVVGSYVVGVELLDPEAEVSGE